MAIQILLKNHTCQWQKYWDTTPSPLERAGVRPPIGNPIFLGNCHLYNTCQWQRAGVRSPTGYPNSLKNHTRQWQQRISNIAINIFRSYIILHHPPSIKSTISFPLLYNFDYFVANHSITKMLNGTCYLFSLIPGNEKTVNSYRHIGCNRCFVSCCCP